VITEPDVTFTDYGLSVECALFTYLLYRQGNQRQQLQTWFIPFFASLGLAALTGGTVHGFFLDTKTTGYAILWPATLIAIGVTALAAWAIGARIQFPRPIARQIIILATIEFVGYCAIVLLITQAFWIAILNYLPAVGFLFIVFCLAYQRLRVKPLLIGLMGLVLTFVAAGVQKYRVAFHPVYFNHNALYHLIQAAALFMIFWAARWLCRDKSSKVRQ